MVLPLSGPSNIHNRRALSRFHATIIAVQPGAVVSVLQDHSQVLTTLTPFLLITFSRSS